MQKRTTLIDVLVESAVIAVSAFLSIVAFGLICLLVTLFLLNVGLHPIIIYAICTVLVIAGTAAVLCLIAYKMGYYTVSGSIPRTIASFSILYAVLFIPTCIFFVITELGILKFLPLERLFPALVVDTIEKYAIIIVPVLSAVLLLAVVGVFCSLFTLFRKLGVAKRYADRKEMGIVD